MDYEVFIKEVPQEHLASVRGVYPIDRLPEVMPREFSRIMAALRAEGVQPAGGALAIYHGWTDDTVDVEIAFTIKGVFFPQNVRSGAELHAQGGVQASMVRGGRVVFTKHVGRYDEIAAAYDAIQSYAKANGFDLAGTMWEKYLTGSGDVPDPSKHVTEIYWPLAK